MTTEPTTAEAILAERPTPFEFDVGVIAKLGTESHGAEIATLTPPAELKGIPAAIPVGIRRGEDPAILDVSHLFEPYRLHPDRKIGQAVAQTFEAFCELTNRHKTGDSVVFADANWKKPSFTAVIDYHEAKSGGAAADGGHRVFYPFPLSEEWQAWVASNGIKLSQEDFAHFLEDRISELSSPTEEERIWIERDFALTVATPSQLVELSRGLQVNISSKVKQTNVLASGEGQIVWEESHLDAAGKPLKVPGMFILSIAPFFMGEKMRIPVRLRYRAAGQAVIWFYQIYRPDQFVTEHVRNTLFEAREKTGLPAYEGTPEMPL